MNNLRIEYEREYAINSRGEKYRYYSCSECAALVPDDKIQKHTDWHAKLIITANLRSRC
jgi:hypothetical protein